MGKGWKSGSQWSWDLLKDHPTLFMTRSHFGLQVPLQCFLVDLGGRGKLRQEEPEELVAWVAGLAGPLLQPLRPGQRGDGAAGGGFLE